MERKLIIIRLFDVFVTSKFVIHSDCTAPTKVFLKVIVISD